VEFLGNGAQPQYATRPLGSGRLMSSAEREIWFMAGQEQGGCRLARRVKVRRRSRMESIAVSGRIGLLGATQSDALQSAAISGTACGVLG